MTRTEVIAAAIAKELKSYASFVNTRDDLRGISFDVKLKPGTITVRTVLVRPETGRELNGKEHNAA